jgi:hypothetical protein
MEPAATFGGRLFYSLFHHEPIRLREICPPFIYCEANHEGGFANMGMAEGLFVRNLPWTKDWLVERDLQLQSIRYRDVIAYPFTGGYSKPAMLSAGMVKASALHLSIHP